MKKIMIYLSICVVFNSIAFAQNPLAIPPTLTGTEINLNLQNGQIEFYNGFTTNTIGYNQAILGPTLILEKGSEVTINVANNLDEPTTLHWHGLHVSAKNDGGPHTVIEAGQVWSPSFTVLDNAATYWYHPHLHERTEEQVTEGAAGFIIVKDDEEAQLELPRTYGTDDFPIVIQSRAFDSNKQFVASTAADDVLLVNGTLDAYLEVPAQVVRLRLLNGSTERIYNLGFQNNLNFHQIATDGSLLNAPVQLTRLRLTPGERAEILVDLASLEGQSINLMSFGSELPSGNYGAANPSVMPMGSIAGYSNNVLNGNDFNVLELNVDTPTSNPITSITSTLITNTPYSTSDIDATRSLLFQPKQMGPVGMLNGPFVINGSSFDMEIINFEIPLNNTEIWELTNMTAIAHPFHIHDVQFYILDINGNPPPTNMKGRKDVVLVPPMFGTVRFITMFEDFADDETPYMYHCHMLSHEDDGMMGQFIIFDNTTSIDELDEESVSVYPNPTADFIRLSGLNDSTIELYNTSGQLLERRESANGEEEFGLSDYGNGVYYLNVITSISNETFKVILQK
ncbi:MAG: multicopper oxidase domain-containing protein [Saprospiraceae bacterium]|jgi:bilirubin oxidase|nr:multicopper oxidase domain-containing protein [Saprospiraceae bacterium]